MKEKIKNLIKNFKSFYYQLKMSKEIQTFILWLKDIFTLESDEMINTRKLIRFFVFSIFFFTIIFGITFIIVLRYPKKIHLSNFLGRDVVEVLKELQEKKLRVYIYEKRSQTIPAYHIIAQKPNSGTIVKEKRTILITVSRGKDIGTMPNFKGKSLLEARESLLKIFSISESPLRISEIKQFSKETPKGKIIEHTPKQKTILKGTENILFLTSKGPSGSNLIVKNYRWLNYENIVEELEGFGIDVKIKKQYSDNEALANKIFFQSVKPGNNLQKGNTITFEVGLKLDLNKSLNDLSAFPILRAIKINVPGKQKEEKRQTKIVELFVTDKKEKRKILKEAIPEGKQVNLPYKTIGRGFVEVYIDDLLFIKKSF